MVVVMDGGTHLVSTLSYPKFQKEIFTVPHASDTNQLNPETVLTCGIHNLFVNQKIFIIS